jgi:hypothetical protein
MPATFSVNIGSQFETERKFGILPVIQNLPDNTSKLITPRDVRDAFLTVWASSPIKQTTNSSGTEYIGIDSGNPADRDIKQKIFLGKRSFGSQEIITADLLNKSDNVDIFIYNTKTDSASQSITRMAFLAGTESSLYTNAPYIGSEYNSVSNSLDFVVRNPQLNGGINLFSDTGYVSINGIKFPKVTDNTTGASNGKILRYVGNYPNGYLKWDSSNVAISQLGAVDKVTKIFGGTVSLNGYELEFVNPDMTSSAVGGVPAGFSFSSTSFNNGKWPLSEVIRKILYPKVGPSIVVNVDNQSTGLPYVELASTASISMNYIMTIYPRNEKEYVSDYVISTQVGSSAAVKSSNYGMSFSGVPGTTFNGSVSNLLAASYSSPTYSNYVFSAADIWTPNQITHTSWPLFFSYSATASIQHVYPVYYGFTNSNIVDATSFNNAVKSLNKYVGPYPGMSASLSIEYTGSGYFYFIHQSTTFDTPIYTIQDPNGFIIHDSSLLSQSFLSDDSKTSGLSITGAKTTKGLSTNWKVWKSKNVCEYSYTGKNFTIKF